MLLYRAYTRTYIFFIYMTNTSIMTFLCVNKIYHCLRVLPDNSFYIENCESQTFRYNKLQRITRTSYNVIIYDGYDT